MSTEITGESLRLRDSVVMRREEFGALLYDFSTRRLSFVKDRRLADALQALSAHENAESAILAAGAPETDIKRYLAAIEGLRASGILERRAS